MLGLMNRVVPQLRLVQALECRVCRELILPERNVMAEAAVFGALAYAVCLCGQEPPNRRDPNYRRRFRRAQKARAK